MSNSVLANIGLKAMASQYAGLQTTGHNIANASVAGYSRQSVNLASSPGQWRDGAFFGRGVDVTSVTRMHNGFLTAEAGNTTALASMDATRLGQLQALENLFPTGENGLGAAASQFFKSMADVTSQPGDLSARRVALARASDMAARFREASSGIESLQQGVTTALSAAVTEINGLATTIANVNKQISAVAGLGQPPNDLLDQRDQLVAELSSKIRIDRVDGSDGTTSISIAGGQQLVLGANASQMRMVKDPADPTRSALAIVNGSIPRVLDENTLGGGAVTGLLKFQNDDLVQGRNLIGRMAMAVGSAINDQQARGISLQPPLGASSGAALFSLGAPRSSPNSSNARDGNGDLLGSVSMTITDASVLQASDYSLVAGSAAGTWELTRLSDGVVRTINSGDVVDGVQIDISNAQAADRFLLQPVGRAALTMHAMLNDPRDLAAASPLVATIGVANTGTARVAGLQMTGAPQPDATVQVQFSDDNGSYDWSLVDSGGIVLGSGSAVWQAGSPIPPSGSNFNGFTLQLQGVPRAGDTVTVAPIAADGITTNNGNALSLMALNEAMLVDGRTATDAYAQAMADIGVRVQSGETTASISTAMAQQAESARSSFAGVNLDEEAAKLLQYQQGYQAAAKVLTVAQSLFDTLLQATSR